jgi:DNA-binding SARP family transcriptional activator
MKATGGPRTPSSGALAMASGGERDEAVRVRLQLLDGFELRCDGRPVSLPMGGQRLLAFLALHPHSLLRVHVAGSLWLDAREDRAFASLRSALWRVHQAGYALVDSANGCLSLAPAVRVDLHRATGLARSLLQGDRASVDVEWRLLAGDLLPDWHDEWVLLEREHHRHLGLQALEVLTERLLAAGEHPRALEVALASVAKEPLRESAHRMLVKVHLAEGNWFEAIRQYRFYKDLVYRQLGLGPSWQMEELVRDLIRDEAAPPERRPAAAALVPRLMVAGA